MTLQARLLLGRFLTRSGDQAWDFAVPIILLKLFPDQIRVAALYFLFAKLLNVIVLPKLASLIDRLDRLTAARVGIFLQFIGVLVGALAVYALSKLIGNDFSWSNLNSQITFAVLVAGGLISSLGSSFMDIAIANDLVPSSLTSEELPHFNSRLRQLDLFTEVTSPVAAGLLLLLNQPPLLGFFLVALWNLISFFPELLLIQSVLRDRPALLEKRMNLPPQIESSLVQKIALGWRTFFKEPIALAALAYAFLWLSVLSPHGVLLTGFLKDGWHLPEWAIGIFRGAGAVFGLIATVLYPWGVRRWGLVRASRNFLVFQTITLFFSLALMLTGTFVGQVGFLACVLLSRIGLYGFSLGEMQIRQIGIRQNVRGEVNGFATALTGGATLLLYTGGALLSSTEDFKYLIMSSVLFVAIGCATFLAWTAKSFSSEIESQSHTQNRIIT